MSWSEKDLTRGSVFGRLMRFSLPFLLSNFLQACYGLADTLAVSWFSGRASITGVTQGSQVTLLIINFVMGFCIGSSVMVAQYLGANRHKDKKETISTFFSLLLLSSAAVTAIMLLSSGAILNAMKIPAEAFGEAKAYINVCSMGTVFVFMYNGISAVLQGLGDSTRPLWFVAIACVINIALDILLVGVFGWGARGAAYATVLAQAVSVLFSVAYLVRINFDFEFTPKSFKIFPHKAALLLKLGLPSSVHKMTVAFSFLVVSAIVNDYGLAAASVSGIVGKINTFAVLPFLAMQSSISAMAGQNIGAKQFDRAKKTMFYGIGITFVCAVVLFAAAQIFPAQIVGILTPDPELIEKGVPFLRYYSIEYLFMAFSFCIGGLALGSGHPAISMLCALVSAVLLRVPLALLFSKTFAMGFNGIALGGALAPLGSVIAGAIFYFSGKWKQPSRGMEM